MLVQRVIVVELLDSGTQLSQDFGQLSLDCQGLI